MKILSRISLFVIVTAIFFTTFSDTIIAQSDKFGIAYVPALAAVSIGFSQIFITAVLFIFIPIAFVGMILRFIGFKKQENASMGWKWNVKQAISRFVKFFFYHI